MMRTHQQLGPQLSHTSQTQSPHTNPPEAPLGERAAHGIVWTFAQGGLVKVVNVIGQFILAWLVNVEDFGWVAMAFVVASFVWLVAAGGLKELLIKRWREFPQLATAAFWLSVVMGVAGTIL